MKKMYYVYDLPRTGLSDEWQLGKYETKEEAIEAARLEWLRMADSDKKKKVIEVRDYEHDMESEDCDNFDYSPIEWGYRLQICESGDWIETVETESKAFKALEAYVLEDEKEAGYDPDELELDELVAKRQELLEFYEVIDCLTGQPLSIDWTSGNYVYTC